jgi:AraC-like DNA-binding protein
MVFSDNNKIRQDPMQHVSTIYARFITRELALSNDQIDQLLSGSSLDAKQLFELLEMPYRDFFDFLTKVSACYTDADLGLKVGQKLTPISFGELGSAILSAPNLLESLMMGADYIRLSAAYYDMRLSAKFDSLVIEFIELTDLSNTQQFQTEVLILAVQNYIEALLGRPFIEGEYYFPYRQPKNTSMYPQYFHSAFAFNKKHASIKIPKHLIEIQSPFHNPELWKSYQIKLAKYLNNLINLSENIFTHKISSALNAYLPPLPSVEELANTLHMTDRTLNRRLKNEGTNFREIKNEVLKNHALFYLSESDLTVDAIACQLGYKDFSSFRRAFKKWQGMSPQKYRETIYSK